MSDLLDSDFDVFRYFKISKIEQAIGTCSYSYTHSDTNTHFICCTCNTSMKKHIYLMLSPSPFLHPTSVDTDPGKRGFLLRLLQRL